MALPPEIAEDRSGQTVGDRWRLIRFLGSGGMASVYEATDASGQRVALKILHAEMARRRELKERFLREAYVANRIGHPGIVRVLEHADGPDVFLVLELLEGESLGARLQRADQFTVRDLLGCSDQILSALGAAHAAGVVHRDIKPDNVFVPAQGGIKILDFGIARVIDDVPSEFKTRTGLALGTIPYMAPEQALGRRGKVDGRTDLFALGALMFRALAGRRIHEEPSEAELLVAMATKPAPRLAEVAPATPPAVCAIVDRALAFSQDARYPDAATMQRDVRAVLEGTLPHFAMAATARAEEATRIEGPASLREAPTVVSPAPITVVAPGPSQAPASLAAPGQFAAEPVPASLPPYSMAAPGQFAAEPVPASLPPYSMAGAPPAVAAPLPAPKKHRGAVAFLVFAAFGLVALGLVAAVVLVVRPWESPSAAASASPEVANAAPPAGSAPSAAEPTPAPADPSEPGPGPAGTPVPPSKPASAPAKSATPGPSAAPAPSSASPKSAALTPSTSPPSPAPAATPSPSAAPPPPASTEPKGDPGKGKGKPDKKLSKPK